MRARRKFRVAATALAIGVVAAGIGVAPAAAQKIDPKVRNVKKVKPPKNCPDIQGVTDDEIKVGAITAMTGPLSQGGFYSNIISGIEARIAAANDADELGGRKVTIATFDDKGDASQNLAGVQHLVEQEKVYAMLPESPAGAAGAPYLSQKGIPVVGWQLGLDIFGKYPTFFGFQNSNAADLASNYSTRNAVALREFGAKNVALLSVNVGNGATFIEQVADAVKREGKKTGMKVVYKNIDVPVGNTEWGSYAQQIKDAGADALYTGLSTTDSIGLLNALQQAGASVETIILPGGYDPRVAVLPAFDGAYLGIEFKPLETTPEPPGIAAFKAAMARYKPNATVNQSSAVGWLTGETFIEGLKAAGLKCPTWDAFINNLRLVKGYTADGWFEPISFQEVFNKPFTCAYYVRIVNQQFVPQNGGEPICGGLVKNNKLQVPTPAATTPPTTAAAG